MVSKWSNVNLYSEENKPKVSRIISLEMEITNAVMNGHKPHMGDEFKEKRNEIIRLRKELLDSVK